jgi:hypothetical protein
MNERLRTPLTDVMLSLRFLPSPETATGNSKSKRKVYPHRAFETIEEKLKRNNYASLQDWRNDVEGTIRKYEESSSDPLYLALARYARVKFYKLCAAKHLFTMETWSTSVEKLREKAVIIMESGPPKAKARATPLLAKLIRARPAMVVSDRELRNFVAAAEKLTDDDDHRALIQILRDDGLDATELNKLNVTFDLTTLNVPTIRRLQAYVRTALEAKGIPYPD